MSAASEMLGHRPHGVGRVRAQAQLDDGRPFLVHPLAGEEGHFIAPETAGDLHQIAPVLGLGKFFRGHVLLGEGDARHSGFLGIHHQLAHGKTLDRQVPRGPGVGHQAVDPGGIDAGVQQIRRPAQAAGGGVAVHEPAGVENDRGVQTLGHRPVDGDAHPHQQLLDGHTTAFSVQIHQVHVAKIGVRGVVVEVDEELPGHRGHRPQALQVTAIAANEHIHLGPGLGHGQVLHHGDSAEFRQEGIHRRHRRGAEELHPLAQAFQGQQQGQAGADTVTIRVQVGGHRHGVRGKKGGSGGGVGLGVGGHGPGILGQSPPGQSTSSAILRAFEHSGIRAFEH